MSLPYAKMLCDAMLCSGSNKKICCNNWLLYSALDERKDNIDLNVFFFVVDDKIEQNKRKLS